jgi:hypothetical protein
MLKPSAMRRLSQQRVLLAVRSTARVGGSAEQCLFGCRHVWSLLGLVEWAEANFTAVCEARVLMAQAT